MTDDQIKLRPANENPWYVLATYHGEQTGDEFDEDLHAKNRDIWNRWMAAALSDEDRQKLIDEERATAAELKPFSAEQRRELWASFRSRELPVPDPATDIDFTETVFACPVSFDHFIFPARTSFVRSEFGGQANYQNATFERYADFHHAVFYWYADFRYSAFQEHAYFQHIVFHNYADFRHVSIKGNFDFRRTMFQGNGDFEHATFNGTAVFAHATFLSYAVFLHTTFKGDADLQHATFQYNAVFEDAVFLNQAVFQNAAFETRAIFQHAAFKQGASFLDTQFKGLADFRKTIFQGDTFFRVEGKSHSLSKTCQFGGITDFSHAVFNAEVFLTNREFCSETRFNSCKFLTCVPELSDCRLHEGTTWHDVQWPQTPSNPIAARDMADAYSHLRRRSNAIQDHEAELDFYGRELRAKRAAVGGATGFLISLYEWSCGFGASVHLPVFWLLGLWTGLAPVYHLILQHAGRAGIDPAQMYGFSLASLGGFFGMRKEFFADFTENLPAMAQTLSGAQSLLGAVFVFLLGLSLRNRFRIK